MAQNKTISIGFKIENGKDGFKQLTLDVGALRKALSSTVVESDKLNKKFINLSALSTSLKTCKEAFSELSSAFKEITGESVEFSSAMKATNTMAGKDAAGLEKLKNQVTDLAKVVPLTRDALAEGLYQVISNGVPEENWISFLNDSSRAAVGGIADLGQTVGVTSTIIKNYGLEWDKAGAIQDKIQLTAKNGVTSFEQMAASLPKVTGNAATLGVSIDELMASFATLTGVSGNTAEVATQLGAIFTSLVKPSSQASKMAEEMGIQFDAAAIKAAGGFSNFIDQLKRDVQSYAQTSGMLEQEIYSTLFGSAESVRALIPLTGELANKFQENVMAMQGSAGTIDQAFGEMATTAESKSQLMKNAFAGIRDLFTGAFSWAVPVLSFADSMTSAAVNAITLKEAIVKLGIAAKVSTVATKGLSLGVKALGISSGSTAELVKVMSQAFKEGRISAIALKVAIRGLLIVTGVGAAIWALSEAVNYFTGVSDKGGRSASDLARSIDVEKRSAEMAADAADAESAARKRAGESMALYIGKLEAFKKVNGSKEEELKLVKELNSAYGDTMGYFKSVSEWYEALKKNSEAYCRQMVAEAKTRKYASQIAEIDEQIRNLQENEDGTKKVYSKTRKTVEATRGSVNSYGPTGTRRVEVEGTSEQEIIDAKIEELKKQKEHLEELNVNALSESASIVMPVMGSKENPYPTVQPVPESVKKSISGQSLKPEVPEGSIQHVKNQISDIDKKITFSVDPDEVFRLEREKISLQNKLKDLELPIKIAGSQEKISEMLGEIEPIKIDFEVDMDSLTKEVQEIPKGLSSAEKLKQTLGSVSSAASAAGDAFKGMGQAFDVPALNIVGIIAGAIATMIQGYAAASSESSSMGPFGWAAFSLTGLAQLMTMISQVKSAAAFADGGVVYGPTLGLVGEYAGARSNPEVIAPLNKLRDIIGDTPGRAAPVIVGGKIEMAGRKMAIVLENNSKISGVSGRRYKL